VDTAKRGIAADPLRTLREHDQGDAIDNDRVIVPNGASIGKASTHDGQYVAAAIRDDSDQQVGVFPTRYRVLDFFALFFASSIFFTMASLGSAASARSK